MSLEMNKTFQELARQAPHPYIILLVQDKVSVKITPNILPFLLRSGELALSS
jgi:hypothetical protein